MDAQQAQSWFSVLLPILPYLVIGIGILLILVIITLVIIRVRAQNKAEKAKSASSARANAEDEEKEQEEASATPAMTGSTPREIQRSFKNAVRLLKSSASGRNYRYEVPWFLMLGESASGKSTALANTGLNLTFGKPEEEPGMKAACNWWFFDGGLVLDIAGGVLFPKQKKSGGEKAWKTLLRQLQKHRAQRPIDGVILTLPCTDFIGNNALSEEEAQAKSNVLYQKIWDLQRTIGLCFPVYVLVTKCDAIRGFKALTQAVSPQQRENIWGWSSPYSLETAYTAQWMDEAFNSVKSSLYQTQLELFAGENAPEAGDDIFVLPDEFENLLEPMRAFLNPIFKSSVYHESFFFRGVYFAGDSVPDIVPQIFDTPSNEALPLAFDAPIPKSSVPTPPVQPAFLKHLLEKKIFPEFALARPAARRFLAQSRFLLATQIAIVLVAMAGTIGLTVGYNHLYEKKKMLGSVLQNFSESINQSQHKKGDDDFSFYENTIMSFIKYASLSSDTRLISASYPSSWFSPIHDDITNAMTIGYNHSILKAMYYRLNQRTKEMTTLAPITKTDSAGAGLQKVELLPADQTPEFLQLKQFTDDILVLESFLTLYNSLSAPGQGEVERMTDLIKYLYNVEMPAKFSKNAYYLQHALERSEYKTINVETFKERSAAKCRELTRAFYAKIFEKNPALVLSRNVNYIIENLADSAQVAERGLNAVQNLRSSLEQMEIVLTKPEFSNILRESFDLGTNFQQVIAQIQRSQLLGPALSTETYEIGKITFEKFKSALAEEKNVALGTVYLAENGKYKIAPGLASLKPALDGLLAQSFAVLPQNAESRLWLGQTAIIWNNKMLDEALKFGDTFQQFANASLKNFPISFQNTLKTVAVSLVEANMRHVIAQAQSPSYASEAGLPLEERISNEVANFAESTKPLAQLLSSMNQLGISGTYRDLLNLTSVQASNLLLNVNELLEREGMYDFDERQLQSWDGQRNLSGVMFNVKQGAELADVLESGRERLKVLAEDYSKPLVGYLTNKKFRKQASESQIVQKWQGIIAELAKYEGKKPGSSLAALESFMLTELDGITIENYYAKTSGSTNAKQAGDYFQQKRTAMKRGIFKRAQVLADGEAMTGYAELETIFNERLANKYPFSAPGGGESRPFEEAEPEDIRLFYKSFDKYAKAGYSALKRSSRADVTFTNAMRWLEQMEQVRRIFAPYLAEDSKSPVPEFEFDTEFRTNQRGEVGGNQIVDWNFIVGDQFLSYRTGDRKGRWTWGSPLRLSLRWAKDGLTAPMLEKPAPNTRLEDKSVIFEFTNRWSLISFLQTFNAVGKDADWVSDTKPHTLRFFVATKSAQSESQIATGQTKVFMRVQLNSTDAKRDRVILPVFPAFAPQLVNS